MKMTTEREYRELHRKIKKLRKSRDQEKYIRLLSILSIILLSASPLLHQDRSLYFDAKNDFFQTSIKLLNPKPDRIGISATVQNNDYTNLDSYAATLNYNGTSTSELASLLSQYAKTDIERARIIYAWIAYHIAYDVESFFNGKYKYNSISPKTVLTTRKTVCSGYAELYKALATKMKLEVVVIEGYAKGYSYVPGNEFTVNHAWNAVKIDSGWYLLDSTWGTGSVNNSHQFVPNFNSDYFATAPEQFIYDHFPVDSAWQLLPNPYSKKQFEDLPKLVIQVE